MTPARPIEVAFLVASVVGFCCVTFSFLMVVMYIREMKARSINGMRMYIAKSHLRDETIRGVIMLCLVTIGLLMVLDPLEQLPQQLITARYLLIIVDVLLVAKSMFNIRDGFKLNELQNARRQRADDTHDDVEH